MSKFLERFRSLDTRKFQRAFGISGTLTDDTGQSRTVVAIDKDPYQSSSPVDQAFQNEAPHLWLVTADLQSTQLRGWKWCVEGQPAREIVSAEPNPRTGFTRVTLTEL